jgi:hypothetical protein
VRSSPCSPPPPGGSSASPAAFCGHAPGRKEGPLPGQLANRAPPHRTPHACADASGSADSLCRGGLTGPKTRYRRAAPGEDLPEDAVTSNILVMEVGALKRVGKGGVSGGPLVASSRAHDLPGFLHAHN